MFMFPIVHLSRVPLVLENLQPAEAFPVREKSWNFKILQESWGKFQEFLVIQEKAGYVVRGKCGNPA